MKTILIILSVLLFGLAPVNSQAQTTEVVQLLLNVEKLAQLKSILGDLKKGYDIFDKGYSAIKDLSQGNFSLHKTFLDALMEASPSVKKYYKVGKIVEYEVQLVREYKSAYNRFRESNMLNPSELNYVSSVYANLLNLSLRNLDELANVVTSGRLRMSDDERLKAIDGIYLEMEDKLAFLKNFNGSTAMLTRQRLNEKNETNRLKDLHGIK